MARSGGAYIATAVLSELTNTAEVDSPPAGHAASNRGYGLPFTVVGVCPGEALAVARFGRLVPFWEPVCGGYVGALYARYSPDARGYFARIDSLE
jgi:hypothetical protein